MGRRWGVFGDRVTRTAIGMVAAASWLGCGPQTDPGGVGFGFAQDGGAKDAPTSASADAFRPLAPPSIDNPGDAACAARSVQAIRRPLDLVMLIDSSGSMEGDTSTPNVSKWDAVKGALKTFFGAPGSAGLGLALSFFPQIRASVAEVCAVDRECGAWGPCNRQRTCTGVDEVTPCAVDGDCARGERCVLLGACSLTPEYCIPIGAPCGDGVQGTPTGNVCLEIPGYCGGRDVCEATAYATPAVTFGPLPQASATLVQTLDARVPDGLTPTGPALAGAFQQARARAAAQPGRSVAVVVATDGFPTECDPIEVDAIAQLARGAANAQPAVPTFVVGVFGPKEEQVARRNLDTIARAGGTTTAHLVTTNQNVGAGFLAALNRIRQQALACSYAVPQPPMGETLDHFRVNVQHTSGSGDTRTLTYVRSRAACVNGGWYYDREPLAGAQPTTIEMCAQTCADLGADVGGRVDILLGCATNVVD